MSANVISKQEMLHESKSFNESDFVKSTPDDMFVHLLDGSITVEAGAATLLMVVFLGSFETEDTATGMAVVYSTPWAAPWA